jgi:DNA-binding LytR/AlgR family response regulator
MQILILEDEGPAAERLQNLLGQLKAEVDIAAVLDSVDDAIAFLQKSSPDLIISDVELADGTCFDVFAEVAIQTPVIFTTAYNQYAIKAFETNAIDYLLKPVDKKKLEAAFTRFRERVNLQRPEIDYSALADAIESKNVKAQKRYMVQYGNKMFVVNPNDAAYFYSEQKATYMIDKAGKSFPLDQSLSKVEEDLEQQGFFRINRNLIVHIDSIEEMHSFGKGRIRLRLIYDKVNSDYCTVSTERAPAFRKWLKGK